jgi:protein disulfide isomerase family A protein 3
MLRFVAVSATLLALAFASDVYDFKDADFDTNIKEHEVILVEFFAPWCGHCKRLAPEYEKAATKLKTNDPPIALAKVDCTSDKATCDKFGVSGFPTLKIFRNGELSQDYDGPREADGIVKYMRGQAGPSSKELNSLADFEKFIASDECGVIGLFEGESKLKDSFQKVADTERDRFRFAHTTNAAIIKKTGYTDDIVIFVPKRLHNKFEEAEIKYDGNYDTDKIKKFLIGEMHGLAGVRSHDNTWQFDKKPLVVVYFNVDYVKDPKGTNYWRNRVLKVAQEYKRKVNFAISNKDDFSQEVEEHGLGDKKDSKEPIVAAQTDLGKFPMNAEFSIENLKKFVEDLLGDKLESYMKSEPVPERQDNVKVVVGRNYKQLIEDADKDVLIEFYAPWCGHCKKLTPIYEELADKLEDEEVIIAKMDATANDVPPKFEVKGFPTLYWIPKGRKGVPEPYRGGRELDDFVKFIAKESSDGLKGFTRDGKKKKKSEL